MSLIGSLTKGVKGIISYGNRGSNVNQLNEMNADELLFTANKLKEENKGLKERLYCLESENGLLQNSVINNEKGNPSQFGRLFNSLKSTILSLNDPNLNDFKSYLYNQHFFLGGIEEDDADYINQFHHSNDDEWERKRDIYLFKQMLLERNYRELMTNMLGSSEINTYILGKKTSSNGFNNNKKDFFSSQQQEKKKDIENQDEEYVSTNKLRENIEINNNVVQSKTSDNNIKRQSEPIQPKTLEHTISIKTTPSIPIQEQEPIIIRAKSINQDPQPIIKKEVSFKQDPQPIINKVNSIKKPEPAKKSDLESLLMDDLDDEEFEGF